MKSRGVYETPGGTILMEAHAQLEELILDRDTLSFKKGISEKFANLVYEGKWFTPLREACQAFVESIEEKAVVETTHAPIVEFYDPASVMNHCIPADREIDDIDPVKENAPANDEELAKGQCNHYNPNGTSALIPDQDSSSGCTCAICGTYFTSLKFNMFNITSVDAEVDVDKIDDLIKHIGFIGKVKIHIEKI